MKSSGIIWRTAMVLAVCGAMSLLMPGTALAQSELPLMDEGMGEPDGSDPFAGHTLRLRDDPSGGDCVPAGHLWDASTKTCTLTGDVIDSAILESPDVTLDCAGSSIINPGAKYFGVAVVAPHATIVDCTIRGFIDHGILIFDDHTIAENNEILESGFVTGQGSGISVGLWARAGFQVPTTGAVIRGNYIDYATRGIVDYQATSSLIENNEMGPTHYRLAEVLEGTQTIVRGNISNGGGSGGSLGSIAVRNPSAVEIRENILTNGSGVSFDLNPGAFPASGIEVTGNVITGADLGVNVSMAPGVVFEDYARLHGNDIFGNDLNAQVLDWSGLPVPAELSYAGEGNYWGHPCDLGPPYFVPGADSNDPAVVDSFAYGIPVAGVDPRPEPSGCPGPIDELLRLIQVTMTLNLQEGIQNSLDVKLDNALAALEDINDNNDVSAINRLEAFINEVQAQSGQMIPAEAAADLIARAQTVIALLGGTP